MFTMASFYNLQEAEDINNVIYKKMLCITTISNI